MSEKGFGAGEFGPIWEKILKVLGEVQKRYDVPVKIAIVGFGKSGKSTLFNALFGKKVAETGAQTDLTGKERSERLFGTILTDTRGFGTKLVPLEEIKKALAGQNLIIHCINGMSAITADDSDLYNFCKQSGKGVIVVVTKADAMKQREIEEYRESLLKKIDAGANPIFLSAETGLNMTSLVNRIAEVLPESAKDAFIAKQQADLHLKRKRARALLHGTSVAAAGVAVSPIPVSDVIVLIPMQASMVASIGRIYGYDLTLKRAKEIIAVAGGGVVLRYAFQALVKLLPVFGSIIGPAIAYGGTVAIGEAAILYFESGMKATPEEVAEAYRTAKEKAETDFQRSRMEDRVKAKENELKEINEKLDRGEISIDEYERRAKELLE